MIIPPWGKNLPKKKRAGEVLVKFKWGIPINPIILLPIPSGFSSSHASGYVSREDSGVGLLRLAPVE